MNWRAPSHCPPHSCSQLLNFMTARMRSDNGIAFGVQNDCAHEQPITRFTCFA